MPIIAQDVVIKELVKETKNLDEKTVCGHCGYVDCVCTLQE